MHKTREIWDTNRSVKQKPCHTPLLPCNCDFSWLHLGEKCPICGQKQGKGNKLKPSRKDKC